jgi:hypothetical protein
MKRFRLVARWVLALALASLVTGCATSRPGEPVVHRFREGNQADAVLRFSSWEYTFLVKPFYAEDGYMQQVRPDTLSHVFDQFDTQRDMAVVVVGWQYTDELLTSLVTDWNNILRGCGFDRVVIVRPQERERLNGSIIVDDSSLSRDLAQNAF